MMRWLDHICIPAGSTPHLKWLVCVLLDHRYELRSVSSVATGQRVWSRVYVCERCGDRS